MSKTHGQPVSYASSYTVNSVTWMKKLINHYNVACCCLPWVPWGSCSRGPKAHWPQSKPEPSYPSHQSNEPGHWPLPLPRPVCVFVRTWNQYRSAHTWAEELSKRSFTLDMKIPASMIDLMCLNQSEFSSPKRNSLMEGERSAETKKATMTTDILRWSRQTHCMVNFIYNPEKTLMKTRSFTENLQ